MSKLSKIHYSGVWGQLPVCTASVPPYVKTTRNAQQVTCMLCKMSLQYISDVKNQGLFSESPYPSDFIPAGAEIIVGMDHSAEGDCTIKGFYDPATGQTHIQEVTHTPRCAACGSLEVQYMDPCPIHRNPLCFACDCPSCEQEDKFRLNGFSPNDY